MKHLLSFLFIIILSAQSCLFAQTDSSKIKKETISSFSDEKDVKNEIGFDMHYFLSLFKSVFTPEPSTIFSVQYNRDLSKKITLRTTLGLGYQNVNNKQDTFPSLNTKELQFVIKAGISWEKKIFKWWQIYYGADIEYESGNTTAQQLTQYPNNINIYSNKYYEIGAGPFLGLSVFINPRVSFNIETNLHFYYTNNTEDNLNKEHPELSSHSYTRGITTFFYVPQNIYLNMKF